MSWAQLPRTITSAVTKVERTLALPVTRPAALTFGGDNLSTLYVTTARFRLPEETLAAEPDAGGDANELLAVDGTWQPHGDRDVDASLRESGRPARRGRRVEADLGDDAVGVHTLLPQTSL
jgi:hypothetical protein